MYRKYQLVGLEIADILRDRAHKALYIKLAKEGDARRLMAIAKDVAERTEVKNHGAYFMRVVMSSAVPGRMGNPDSKKKAPNPRPAGMKRKIS